MMRVTARQLRHGAGHAPIVRRMAGVTTIVFAACAPAGAWRDASADGAHGSALAPRAMLSSDAPESHGTGWVVNRQGAVVTARHVVQGCARVTVRTGAPDSRVATRVQAVSETHDIALLRATAGLGAPATLRPVSTHHGATASTVRAGESVLVAAYPLAGILAYDGIVSDGIVNATAGLFDDRDLFQLSAIVQKGSSGGPVLDVTGQLVGMVVGKVDAKVLLEAMGEVPQQLNFALQPHVIWDFLRTHGVSVRAGPPSAVMDGPALAVRARRMMVRVECWGSAAS